MGGRSRIERGRRAVAIATGIYVTAYALHTVDHAARGVGKTPTAVLWAGAYGALATGIGVALLMARHRLMSTWMVVLGFGTAAGVASIHVLPHWSFFSEPFRGGVSALDWASVAVLIGSALAVGCAAMYTFLAEREAARALTLA